MTLERAERRTLLVCDVRGVYFSLVPSLEKLENPGSGSAVSGGGPGPGGGRVASEERQPRRRPVWTRKRRYKHSRATAVVCALWSGRLLSSLASFTLATLGSA
jgi:hypothetical protein